MDPVQTQLQPSLPPNTIIPVNEDLFIPYFLYLYEDIANAVNSKDWNFYSIAITDTPEDILNLPDFGAYIVCVSGEDSSLPTLTASLCKADSSIAGSVTPLGSQAGTDTWSGNVLTITSTATAFQIAHDRAGVSGNFNIRVIGTQQL